MGRLVITSGPHRVESDLSGKNLLSEMMRILPKHKLPDGFSYADLNVYIAGQLVDLRAYDINRSFIEDVRIVADPKGLETTTLLYISLALSAASVAASFILSPKIPTAQQQVDSPNNGFSGQTNIIRLDALEPNLYGSQISYPDLIVNEGGAWSYVDNQKIVDEVFLIGIGDYETLPPKYEETPFDSIEGQAYTYYYPGDLVPVVQGQFNAEFIDGQTLIGPNNDEVTDGVTAIADPVSTPITIIGGVMSVSVTKNAEWDAIFANFGAGIVILSYEYTAFIQQISPSCLFEDQNSSGQILTMLDNITEYIITINAQGAVLSDCGVAPIGYGSKLTVTEITSIAVSVTMPIKTDELQISFDFLGGLRGEVQVSVFIEESTGNERYDFSYSANTINQLFFTETIPISPPPGDLTVSIARLNDDKVNNSDRIQVSQVATNSYRTNVDYGNRTILKTSRKATQQALQIKDSKVNAEVTRKTVTYNGVSVISTLTASRSFADAMLHEYTEVYGLSSDDLPLDELYQIDASMPVGLNYFDFTFADKEQSIKETLDIISNVARCQMNYTGQGYEVYRNESRTVSMQFDSRNISINSPEEVSYRGAAKTSNNGIKLKWKNPVNNKFEYVNFSLINGVSTQCVYDGGGLYTPSLPTVPLDIDLIGCSTLEQAEDRADLECRSLAHIQKTLKTTVLKDGEEVSRGQLVRHSDYWQDDVTSGEIAGLINGDIFTTHNEIDLPSGTYFVTYTDNMGDSFGPVPCTIIDKNNFMATMPDAYLANGYSIQSGTRYIISTLTEHENNLYVVNDKESNQDGTVTLELVQYDESIYPEED